MRDAFTTRKSCLSVLKTISLWSCTQSPQMSGEEASAEDSWACSECLEFDSLWKPTSSLSYLNLKSHHGKMSALQAPPWRLPWAQNSLLLINALFPQEFFAIDLLKIAQCVWISISNARMERKCNVMGSFGWISLRFCLHGGNKWVFFFKFRSHIYFRSHISENIYTCIIYKLNHMWIQL